MAQDKESRELGVADLTSGLESASIHSGGALEHTPFSEPQFPHLLKRCSRGCSFFSISRSTGCSYIHSSDIGNRQYSSHASSPGSRTTQLTPQTQEPDLQFPPPETEDNDVVQKP